MSEEKCVAGCMVFYGGEIRHHEDCHFYGESLTKIHDEIKQQLAQQKALLDLAGELLVEVDDLFGQHMDERWHDKLNQILGKEEGKNG